MPKKAAYNFGPAMPQTLTLDLSPRYLQIIRTLLVATGCGNEKELIESLLESAESRRSHDSACSDMRDTGALVMSSEELKMYELGKAAAKHRRESGLSIPPSPAPI